MEWNGTRKMERERERKNPENNRLTVNRIDYSRKSSNHGNKHPQQSNYIKFLKDFAENRILLFAKVLKRS